MFQTLPSTSSHYPCDPIFVPKWMLFSDTPSGTWHSSAESISTAANGNVRMMWTGDDGDMLMEMWTKLRRA